MFAKQYQVVRMEQALFYKTMKEKKMINILKRHPIIPVVTFNNVEDVERVVETLLHENIKCIEVTLRNENAFDCIEKIIAEYGDKIDVGVGTVINVSQVKRSKELDVDFIVSPGLNEMLSKEIKKANIPFIPGVSTPSEIINANELGYDVLKFFPANLFGGVDALKTYGKVFPHIKFCPTGGINESNYKEYLNLENVISVGGSWVIK